MDTTVRLDASHFKAAAERARALGKTTQQYLECLIDTDARTFDEILEPVRKGFESVPGDGGCTIRPGEKGCSIA